MGTAASISRRNVRSSNIKYCDVVVNQIDGKSDPINLSYIDVGDGCRRRNVLITL